MGHLFDTGLPRAQRTLIREAVIQRLAPLTRSRGLYVHSVLTYPRQLRDENDDIGLGLVNELVAGNTPAILVALGRMSFESTGMPADSFCGTLAMSLYVISSHGRSYEARLAGDRVSSSKLNADPGVETVLEHASELLCGTDLRIPTVSELRPVFEEEIATLGDAAIWEQRYELRVQRDIDRHRGINRRIRDILTQHRLDGADPATPAVEALTKLETPA